MSLRGRLAVALAAIVLVLVVIAILLPRTVRAAAIEQVDQQLNGAIPLAQRFGGNDIPRPVEPPQGNSLSDIYVGVVARDGSRTTFVASQTAGDAQPVTPATVTPPLRPGEEPVYETVSSVDGGPDWRAALIPARDSSASVLVAIPLDRVEATVTRLRWALLAAGLAVAGVLALAGWWILRLGLHPIAEVTEVADAIAAGERDRRAGQYAQGTEAAHLARAFNVMLDEREAAEDRLRRFVSDASHELRTPVAAIRGFTDLYRHGALDGGEQLGDAMRRIGQEASRMAELVDDLLLLARLDEGRPLERAPIDLSAVLRDAVLDASATHPTRIVTAHVDDGLQVIGDDARLRQVVGNLVVNALVHTDPAATVVVRGTRRAHRIVVEVEDTGAGMDAESLGHAFDRFWRGDPARSRHRAGAGLGLPIVKAIVEAHGGRIEVDSAPGRGTTFAVALPDAQEPRNER